MSWKPFLLDNIAQQIVLNAIEEYPNGLGQAHRLRSTCAYGLERFWGEQIRLLNEKNPSDEAKGKFTQDVWNALVLIMKSTGIELPSGDLSQPPKNSEKTGKSTYTEQVQKACGKIRALDKNEAQASLAVLTSLCDAIVWWKQRLVKEVKNNA